MERIKGETPTKSRTNDQESEVRGKAWTKIRERLEEEHGLSAWVEVIKKEIRERGLREERER